MLNPATLPKTGGTMKVQNNTGDQQPYDLPNGLAKLMISKGEVHVFIPKQQPARATWSVSAYIADNKPYIHAVCGTCEAKRFISGRSTQAVIAQHFSHCKIHEAVPSDIAAEFAEANKSFYKDKKPAPGPVKAITEVMFDMAHFA
jgi:hypothetical protein